jgi:hypothetical protein
MKPRITSAAVCLLAIIWFSHDTRATTLLRMDADSLVDQAEVIFSGEAVKSEVVSAPLNGLPYTLVTFRVGQVLKGSVIADDVILRFEGGDTGVERVEVIGMPQFTIGEQYLLFVRANGSAYCPVLGWWQGQFRFGKDPHGKRIILDHAGVPIIGITRNSWLRGRSLQANNKEPGAILLETEEVEISPSTPEYSPRIEIEVPAAEAVLGILKDFISLREKEPTFVPGRTISSAMSRAWRSTHGQGFTSAPKSN